MLDSPGTWRWIWTATAVIFYVGEMATAGSFFALPFALELFKGDGDGHRPAPPAPPPAPPGG